MQETSEADPFLSRQRLSTEKCHRDPLIVVGLPRSGSSFLSHILSQLPDWYVFDDLYIQRQAQDLRVNSPMDKRDLEGLLFFMGWQIRARLRFGTYAIPNVKEDEVELNNQALMAAFTEQPGSWSELQEEWMRRLAARAGCQRWGYKMPGAFRHISLLLDHYPNARFLFIMRNPYKVLASYKYMPIGHQDGDPRRYHPIAYAVYWRMAVRSYLRHRDKLGPRMTLVRFEELVKQPQAVAEQIAEFLETPAPETVDVPEKPNSSFSGARRQVTLTGLETWIVNLIAKKEMAALGYSVESKSIHPRDFWDFLAISARFARFQLGQIAGKISKPLMQRLKPKGA